tara:strand:- start:8274 stop:8615 length:342 start_codon:yes stop_codon:yes gene_type:complete
MTHPTEKERLVEKWFDKIEVATNKIKAELRPQGFKELYAIRGGDRSHSLFSRDDLKDVIVLLVTYNQGVYNVELKSFDPNMVRSLNKHLRPVRRIEKKIEELKAYELLGGEHA